MKIIICLFVQFSTGGKLSDLHPEHKFLRVKGGFLAVKVYRENNYPVLKVAQYDVNGNIVNVRSNNKKEIGDILCGLK